MNQKEAAKIATECPFDINWHEAIYALYAMQHYESIGKDYAPSIFYNQIFPVLNGLRNVASRKTILASLHNPVCMAHECNEIVNTNGTQLDHLVPKARGGPDNLENTAVLCRSHNSSKGKKDLLEWWAFKQWPAITLDRRVLCVYARMMWQSLDVFLSTDPYDLTDDIRMFITERSANLPTDNHRLALYGSTYAAMAFLGWERMHEPTGVL